MFFRNQTGVALLAVIFFLVVMAFVGVIFISLSSNNMTQSVNEVYSSRALYIAEGGLERAGRYLLKREGSPPCTTCTCASINTSTSFNGAVPAFTASGSGQFTVTSVFNNNLAPTSLFALTDNVTTTIPATAANLSVSGYASFGRIMIDKEMIDYTALGQGAGVCGGGAPSCFVGAVRGADGTAPAQHVIGTSVAQTQCLLTSTGGVPTIGAGTNQRVVSQADVVQNGWAVGNTAGGITPPRMFLWDGSSWADRTAVAPGGIGNLTSVSMLSPADGWAVSGSASGRFIRWNGVNWSSFPLPAARPLNSIYMNASNDGWAVGNPGGVAAQQPLIYYWDGTTWSLRKTGLPAINRNLNSVYCNSNSLPVNCWAVGNAGGVAAQRPLILYWNGASWGPRNSLLGISSNLNSVYCNSNLVPVTCWAVGNTAGGAPANERPFILYWNGATWARQNSLLGIPRNLNSVYCNSNLVPVTCWAVGNPGGGGQRPLILYWNGATWSLRNSVRNFAGTAVTINLPLRSVSCVTSNDCWAVGSPGGAGQRPLVLHWNGTDWIIETLNSQNTILNSVYLIGPKRPNIAWREVPQ
ncbi:MAG: hypothetical protein HY036_07290 [Nitrospirae bacterium]|nr:hypothetical protein [Nitrospirota bacterium]MBI3352367.1 hypothetical protein [Nitrospirota bacterium]